MDQTRYINGSDLLVDFGGKATGHATSHTLSLNTETKDVAVKPAASAASSSAKLYKSKRVTGLSVQIKADGLGVYAEDESGIPDFLNKWKNGSSVAVKAFARSNDANPYLSGNFIISSMEISTPAGEDTTYSITLDNDGEVDIDETKFEPSSGGGEDDDDDEGGEGGGA